MKKEVVSYFSTHLSMDQLKTRENAKDAKQGN